MSYKCNKLINVQVPEQHTTWGGAIQVKILYSQFGRKKNIHCSHLHYIDWNVIQYEVDIDQLTVALFNIYTNRLIAFFSSWNWIFVINLLNNWQGEMVLLFGLVTIKIWRRTHSSIYLLKLQNYASTRILIITSFVELKNKQISKM